MVVVVVEVSWWVVVVAVVGGGWADGCFFDVSMGGSDVFSLPRPVGLCLLLHPLHLPHVLLKHLWLRRNRILGLPP